MAKHGRAVGSLTDTERRKHTQKCLLSIVSLATATLSALACRPDVGVAGHKKPAAGSWQKPIRHVLCGLHILCHLFSIALRYDTAMKFCGFAGAWPGYAPARRTDSIEPEPF